jgi:hypothetical protein
MISRDEYKRRIKARQELELMKAMEQHAVRTDEELLHALRHAGVMFGRRGAELPDDALEHVRRGIEEGLEDRARWEAKVDAEKAEEARCAALYATWKVGDEAEVMPGGWNPLTGHWTGQTSSWDRVRRARVVSVTRKAVYVAMEVRQPGYYTIQSRWIEKKRTAFHVGRENEPADALYWRANGDSMVLFRTFEERVAATDDANKHDPDPVRPRHTKNVTHLRTLGLEPGASDDEIELAWKKLRSQHHPDKGGDASMFARVKAAYEAVA